MKNLIKLKRSTESDTGTEKTSSRWLRLSSQRSELDQLLDLYWGGKERRITGMTLRIIRVNLIALVSLLLGVIYLGQYHQSLVASKLQRFETEISLVNAAIAEGARRLENESKAGTRSELQALVHDLSTRFSLTLGKRILLFDKDNHLVLDTKNSLESALERGALPQSDILFGAPKKKLQSVQILKDMATWIVSLLPRQNKLFKFPGVMSDNAMDYPDVMNAIRNKLSMSAWESEDEDIVLTAAMPLWGGDGSYSGALMLISENDGIREELGDVWFSIVNIFLITLLITILLSIYLSGIIARPLRKLSEAAESVRTGRASYDDIPNMSDRHDEIGELSLVLRDMTYALGERMDAIEAFAADVSHEIKNPLTSLKSAVETAEIVQKEEDRKKLLDVIRHDVDRLDRLISDISHISRLDAALSKEEFTQVDVKEMLRKMISLYMSPLDRKSQLHGDHIRCVLEGGVTLRLDLAFSDHIMMRGSEGRLIQVFHNLVDNALSFSPKDGEVSVILSVDDKRITVFVEDQGPGIPESKLKDVFERFYSERPEHEEYGRHSGLGLSICKQVIKAHNGVIFAENKMTEDGSRKGARFVVILNAISVE